MKETKTYIVKGEKKRFDHDLFRDLFLDKKRIDGIGVADLESILGSYIPISKDAVHSWRNRVNSPSDIETVKKIAKFFGLSDYVMLLKNMEEKTMRISERQRDSLKRVNDAVIDFLWMFEDTNGYNAFWDDYGSKPENMGDKEKLTDEEGKAVVEILNIANKDVRKMELVIAKESFELQKLPVYDHLVEFVTGYLRDMVINSIVGYNIVSTYDELIKARKALQYIIEPYI